MKVAFIGAGEIGTAIFDVLKNKSHLDIFRWDKDESLVPGQLSLEETVDGAKVIFLAVPSKFVRDAVMGLIKFLDHGVVVVSISKGIEIKSLKTMDQVLEECLPDDVKFALLSGPMLGEELSDGLIGAGVVASSSADARKVVSEIFENTRLITSESADVRGVALTGVLKNVYAIALGAFEGLAYGMNARGWLFGSAVLEMGGMIEELGGERGVVLGMSGVGDLIATGFSPYSSNFTLGYEISRGGKFIESEGFISLPSIVELLGENFEKYPVAIAVKKILIDKKDAREVFDELLNS